MEVPSETKPGPLEKQLSVSSYEQVFKPKNKYPTFWMNLNDYFSEYTSATSLHAFQYLGEQKRSIFEKLWWLIVITISIYGSIDLIMKTYDKWNYTPVIVSFAQTPTPIYQIPFPAITICSETKARQRVFNFTDYYHKIMVEGGENATVEEKMMFQDNALLCDPHLYPFGNLTTTINVTDYMIDIAPSLSEALWDCQWMNSDEPCGDIFTTTLTDEGICFTANMVNKEEIFTDEVYYSKHFWTIHRNSSGWTLDSGYGSNAGVKVYPRRAVSAGAKAGLTILLKAYNKDLDYICKGPVQGFKIAMHHPAEIPRVSMQYFRVPLDQEVVVAIKPEMMRTSAGLKDYDPRKRGCYFSNEKNLRFYKEYTQQSCEVECLTNYTLKSCGCVGYHMPHDETTPICGSGSITCMAEAQVKIVTGRVDGDENTERKDDLCEDCLPACTSLIYNAETSQATFNRSAFFTALKRSINESEGIRTARLHLYFKELQFIPSERNELYGLTDFLANCGGLLGLFTGFSFLSLVEIIYFLTIRLAVNLKRHGRHYWSASEDLLNNDAFDHHDKDK